MSGQVTIIGCGPGPNDLLTVRAARAIAAADLVLHDSLVGEDVLSVAARARKLCVGKRAGHGGTDVSYVARLMAREAESGARVARLHGGDPALFGRLAEEVAVLTQKGVPFTIVPGVTAALAAAAALSTPLTARGVASTVVFLAACNRAAVAEAARLSHATLALYMAGARAGAAADELIAAGLSPSTPAALVFGAATAQERLRVRSLAEIGADGASPDAHDGAPVLLLVGDSLAPALAAATRATSNESARRDRRGGR